MSPGGPIGASLRCKLRLLLLAAVLTSGAVGCAGETDSSLENGDERTPTQTRVTLLATVTLSTGQESSGVTPSVPLASVPESPVAARADTPEEPTPTTERATATSVPPASETPTLTAAPTEKPVRTRTPTPHPVSPTVPPVLETRVIYHDGYSDGVVGVYEEGSLPWIDLLAQLGGSWYGPEREPGDAIEALPLPEGYAWETVGGFGSLSNGEAWWVGSGTEGTARLLGPDGRVLAEVPLRVVFRSPGAAADEEPATVIPPTPT